MFVHLGTRDTLLNLAFGMDVLILVEVGINTLRLKYFDLKQNKDNIKANLDLLE